MSWTVAHGTPHIEVDHPPDDWPGDQPFKSCETRKYHVQENANFVLTVPGANQANGDGRRQQSVNVIVKDAAASANAPTCDDKGAVHMVSGPMPTVSSCGAPVARMHDPSVQKTVGDQVENQTRRVCLLDPGNVQYCVDPGGTGTPIGAVVDGAWKIQIPLTSDESCDGAVPGMATVKFDIDCDKVPHRKS
ncbi:MAG: hypothetical protein JO257_38095 [Deltaproteobacteria bacterium]|nr:hypothetical protein [Deltaproteobacteria bacterium]